MDLQTILFIVLLWQNLESVYRIQPSEILLQLDIVISFSEVDAMIVVQESSGSIRYCIGGAQDGTRGTWYTHGE